MLNMKNKGGMAQMKWEKGYWELFFRTGSPIAYLLYRKEKEGKGA